MGQCGQLVYYTSAKPRDPRATLRALLKKAIPATIMLVARSIHPGAEWKLFRRAVRRGAIADYTPDTILPRPHTVDSVVSAYRPRRRLSVQLLCTCALASLGPLCAPLHSHPRGSMPTWRAGEAVRTSELIAVVEGPVFKKVFPRVIAPDVFGSEGEARIRRYVIKQTLWGDVETDSEIVIVQPPMIDHRRYASVYNGEGLAFLKQMNAENVERIRQHLRWGADDLPDVVWTFTEGDHQWMSWIQFIIDIDGEKTEHVRGPLAAHINRHAGVGPDAEDIVEYVKSLILLRQSVLGGVDLPDERDLDRIQRDVVQNAVLEKAQQQD